VSVERELALMAAHLKAEHAKAYADALAAALAQHHTEKLVTGDSAFQLLEGPGPTLASSA
jgi:predicted nucleic acid-binding protein